MFPYDLSFKAPKPVLYIQQMEESAQFYTNKLLKEFRE